MKKSILSLSAIALIAVASVFTGCKKDDTTPPVVTLNGAATQTISLQGTYTELNASANDDVDGAVTPVISGTVNVNLTGTYTITYTATDKAGNAGTATRTVKVVNDADAMSGTYQCTISGSPNTVYTQTITASTTLNKRIGFSYFSDYSGDTGIYADIVGTTVTLTSQTALQVGTPPADRTFAGTGTITDATHFSLTYTETTGGATINTSETFVKQ
jgi:hypothetical protein